MNFALNVGHVPVMRMYDHALKAFNDADGKKFVGTLDGWKPDDRPLAKHRKPYLGITMHDYDKNAIGIRYHETEVARWYPDNTCVLDLSYASRSTQNLANHVCPHGIDISLDTGWAYGGQALIGLKTGYKTTSWGGTYPNFGKWLRVSDVVTVRDTEVLDETRDFTFERIDRKQAKKVLAETRYADFVVWLDAWFAMAGPQHTYRGFGYRDADEVRAALADESQWSQLRRIAHGRNGVLATLREYLYRDRDVTVWDTAPFAPSLTTARKWLKS